MRNIDKINTNLQSITDGDLNVAVNVRSYKGFDNLSTYINSTVATLKDYIGIAKEQRKA